MRRWIAFAVVSVLLGAALVWCQKTKPVAPVGPEAFLYFVADTQSELTRLPVSFSRLSDEDEIRIGNDLASRYSGFGGPGSADYKTIEAYVQKVGARVAVHANRKLPYKFHYLPDSDFINAFALPGGHVFVGAGLMDLMDSEDEMAAVLGHEIEHIDHYHCAERVETQAALQRIPLGQLAALPVEIFEAGYSKDQELEADREGTRLAVLAGYSPRGAVDLFKTFDRLFQEHVARARTAGEELSQTAEATLEGYFRSHPLPSERIAQIERLIQIENWQGQTNQHPLEVAYFFKAARARRQLEKGKYKEAASYAQASLQQKPDQPQVTATLAAAEFALMQYEQARGLYQGLLSGHPAESQSVVDFGLDLARRSLEKHKYGDAANFAVHILDLQPLMPRALVLETEAGFAQRDFVSAAEAYRALANKSPNDTAEVIRFTDELATQARDQGKYEQAAEFAAHSLELEPNQPSLVEVFAEVELTLANFANAAKAFHLLLVWQKDKPMIGSMERFADSLGAAGNSRAGAQEFQEWFQGLGQSSPTLAAKARVEVAGLELMAGDEGPVRGLVFEAGRPETSVTYESLGRLGWWYYRAGKYGAAYDVLAHALLARPGEPALNDSMGWVLLEKGEFSEAMRRFDEPMGHAVDLWLSGEDDKALEVFVPVTKEQPAWLNPRFVQSFYSPRVASAVEGMKAEHEKRLRAARKT